MDPQAQVKEQYKAAFKLFAEGDVDGSIQAFQEVIGLDPTFALAYQALSEAFARKGDLDSAIGAIRRAIEAEPTEPLYHTSLSRFLQQQGKIPEAEAAALAASRIQQGSF